jgi:hypothetical protein
LNKILLKNTGIEEEMSTKIKKYFELLENGSRMYQNLWISEKTVTRGKFIAMNTCIEKDRSKIKTLNFILGN